MANGQLPQDIMHVLFEGVLPKVIKLMLNKFINEQKYFTLDTLNERVKNFAYGRAEARNRPPKPFTPIHVTTGRLPLSGELNRILLDGVLISISIQPKGTVINTYTHRLHNWVILHACQSLYSALSYVQLHKCGLFQPSSPCSLVTWYLRNNQSGNATCYSYRL